MATLEGIRVDVRCAGQPLRIYADPELDHQQDRERRYYVEAVTDSIFCLDISWESFDLSNCDGITISIKFDGTNEVKHFYHNEDWMTRFGCSTTMDHITKFDAISKKWIKLRPSFASLDILEASSTAVAPADLKALGSIEVKVKRRYATRTEPLYIASQTLKDRVSQVSEKTMKGQAVSNTVNFIKGEVAERPQSNWTTSEIPGGYGKSFKIQILYRSRHALQILGCIPRTPSPERANSESDDGVDRMKVTRIKQENEALKKRLARLERNRNGGGQIVDLEDPTSSPAASPGPSGGVKRERTDDCQFVSSSSKRRRAGQIETIDLTDD